MSAPVTIKDSKDGQAARVTRFGQLVVAPLAYSQPASQTLDEIDTAFNLLTPESGKSIVITDVIISADKSISVTDPAEVEIYQANEIDSLVAEGGSLNPRLLRGDNFILTGLNVLIPEGMWINAKTNDSTILVTLLFYRVPVEDL